MIKEITNKRSWITKEKDIVTDDTRQLAEEKKCKLVTVERNKVTDTRKKKISENKCMEKD